MLLKITLTRTNQYCSTNLYGPTRGDFVTSVKLKTRSQQYVTKPDLKRIFNDAIETYTYYSKKKTPIRYF